MTDIPPTDAPKRAAGYAAAELVEPGMKLGLGTGSTVRYFLEALAERGLDVAGIPTSKATEEQCRTLGIDLLDPESITTLDLAVDGADEFTPELSATKGGGGALLREKVVASLAERFVLIASPDKAVDRLGDTFPLPIEVVPFAVSPVSRAIAERGARVTVRREADGTLFRTDNGNAIVTAHYPGGIEDTAVEEITLTMIPGVVCCGLFVEMADLAVLGHPDGSVEHRGARAADDPESSV